ncbi:MAG: thiamine-binding protein [Acidimicrobiia bacterium]|nr:thiamine-binding protein [Acidimicrobiia bacterium]
MLRAEFTVEPFITGDRGTHGEAALDAVESSGLDFDDGPFGTTLTGDDDAVIATVRQVLERAMARGATRVSLQLTCADSAEEPLGS